MNLSFKHNGKIIKNKSFESLVSINENIRNFVDKSDE